jgi:hypothetical protein
MKSRIAAAAITLAGVVGCGNTSPEKHTFTIEGPVLVVGERSITMMPRNIVETEGKASKWFKETKPTQVHNNYNNDSCDRKTIGKTFSTSNQPEPLSEVEVGEWVRVEGAILESHDSCGENASSDYRPVYIKAQEMLR